jgi:hypothetical protein
MRLPAACGRLALGLAVTLLVAPREAAAQQPDTAPARGARESSQPSSQPTGTPSPTPQEIAQWAEQLDADEFLTRDTAMLRLLEAGPAALAAVEDRLPGGSVEATSRALYILRQLGLSGDIDAQERAWSALEAASLQRDAPALARRAAATLDQLREQRSVQALAELEALGARFGQAQYIPAFGLVDPVPELEIGEAFRGTTDDLRRLKWLADVSVVKLAGEQVTDAWISHVASIPSMAELHLYQAKISDRGLGPLAEAGKLEQIGIYYTPVGDGALEPLTKVPSLRFAKLYGTQITPAARVEFEQAKGVNVDHRRGAFLGVGASPLDEACLISTVHAGSPAEKAGLAQNDVIVRFGDGKVASFDSLTALISLREAGEEVEIEVLRQTLDDDGSPVLRTVAKKVTLGPWQFDLAVRNGRR